MPTLVAKNGNDCVMTPPELGRRIIQHYTPNGRVLEPCKGTGRGFYQWIPSADWCEITEGRDFFDYDKNVNWILTNPPYSKLTKFLEHSFEIAENVVFLILLPAVFHTAKLRLAREYNFGIKELVYVPKQPAPFPNFGFQLGCVHYQKKYMGDIQITDWTLVKSGGER